MGVRRGLYSHILDINITFMVKFDGILGHSSVMV